MPKVPVITCQDLTLVAGLLLFFLSFLSFSQISIPPFLSSFFLLYRYLIVLYYQPNKMNKKVNVAKKEEDLQKMKEKYGLKEDK